MLDRPRTAEPYARGSAERYARGVAAGVAAVACLLLAANAGPAQSAAPATPAERTATDPAE
ncbi:hypothetical protein [Streptomyces ziwulingensis]|uniref:Uncharacterized protein n=1 Tax=Streptomyces ziwulingensis TaxID=1045501 RepID=A0ABP9BNJ6_9ACTN